MAKERWISGGESQPTPDVGSSLDEVAKELASGTISRGKALRWMGGALVGAALASVPEVAWAAPGGNSACAPFCNQLPPGPERGECTSQGAMGEGPCYSCTPGIGPGPNFVPPECSGGEFNPETCECEVACPTGTTLCGGTCVPNCPSVQTLNTSTCECECDGGFVACGATCVAPYCFGGKILSLETCRCECPAGTNLCTFQDTCVTCPAEQTFNPSNCRCECPAGTVACISGACVSSTCPAGQAVNPSTCRCETAAAGCSSAWACIGRAPLCGSGAQTCVCTASVEGPVVCAGSSCPGRIPCTSSAECEARLGPGSVCQAPIPCGCGQTCIAPCGSPSATSSVSSTGKSNIGKPW
jgi:hypothetical protein